MNNEGSRGADEHGSDEASFIAALNGT